MAKACIQNLIALFRRVESEYWCGLWGGEADLIYSRPSPSVRIAPAEGMGLFRQGLGRSFSWTCFLSIWSS
jgi:hypothetical protein